MKANPDKFQVMFMCPPNALDSFPNIFVISDIEILRQHTAKLLGVIIDDKLKYDEYQSICIKSSRQPNALGRIKTYLPIKERKLIYQSFILSNFNFCPLASEVLKVLVN